MDGIVDTHCHLDFNSFDDDRQLVIEQARHAGVVRILNPGIDLQTSRAAVRLAEAYPDLRAAVGVHPNEGSSWGEQTPSELRSLAAHPGVVAIGEIGLDYYRDRTPRKQQIDILWAQLELAADLGLPVIIHSRKALPDLLPILAEWQAGLEKSGSVLSLRPGVLHSFEGSVEEARQAVAFNFLIGVSGPVTFTNARQRQATIAALPLSHLLLETDAPFLAPHPHRGRRNEPAYVRLIAEKVAELLNYPLAIVAEKTSSNAARLFAWGD